jgi:glutamate racemase
MDNRPIGVFDSGLGGLTAVRRMAALMPNETIVYFGDTGRVPYGSRSRDTIRRYAAQDVNFLRTFDLKAIVIACGTVSSIALDWLAQQQDLPIFGVVEPTARHAAQLTENGRIGIIATQATIRTGAYEQIISRCNPQAQLFAKPCPLFVPLVENGRTRPGDIVIETVVEEYLSSLRDEDIDTLILGCTHYPLLTDVIGNFMGNKVRLLDAGAEVADQVCAWLDRHEMRSDADQVGAYRWYVSDSVENFHHLGSLFLGREITEPVEQIAIENY